METFYVCTITLDIFYRHSTRFTFNFFRYTKITTNYNRVINVLCIALSSMDGNR